MSTHLISILARKQVADARRRAEPARNHRAAVSRRRRRALAALFSTVVGVLVLGVSAEAATFTVTNTHSAGPGSLRQRINQANSGGDAADQIVVAATGTINLAAALPELRTDLTIEGPGARRLTVRRDSASRYSIFTVPDCDCTVELSGLTVANGVPGIRNEGTLTLARSALRRNAGYFGGGIDNRGTLTVSRSTLSGNSVVEGSLSTHARPRGLASRPHSRGVPPLGGAIFNSGPSAIVTRSTLSGNSAHIGGAIADATGTVTITQSTLSANSGALGGALANFGEPSTLQSTIIANSLRGANCYSQSLPSTSEGYNLSDDASCGLTGTGDQQNTEPRLRPLDYYGGPTRTFALRPSSPAVDAGFADGALIDQRGRPRIVDYPGVPLAEGGDNSDIGSFELQSAPSGAWTGR
jgi:hypothetical protein